MKPQIYIYNEIFSILNNFPQFNKLNSLEKEKYLNIVNKEIESLNNEINKLDEISLVNLSSEIEYFNLFSKKIKILNEIQKINKYEKNIKKNAFKEINNLLNDSKINLNNARNKKSLNNTLMKYIKDKLTDNNNNFENRKLYQYIYDNSLELSTLYLLENGNFDHTVLDIIQEHLNNNDENNEYSDFQSLMLNRMDDNPLFWECFEFTIENTDLIEDLDIPYENFPSEIKKEAIKPYQIYSLVLGKMNGILDKINDKIIYSEEYITQENQKKINNLEKKLNELNNIKKENLNIEFN